MNEQELTIMVLVKAAPIAAEAYDEECVCLAGMTLDEESRWIRLFPVPYRYFAEEHTLVKYQELTLRAVKTSNDRRPESWLPIRDSMNPGRFIDTQHSWSERRLRVGQLGERTMCDLHRENEGGSGPDTSSLAVVRTESTPELVINRRPQEEIDRWKLQAERIANKPSLFDSNQSRTPIEVVPWRFRYRYRCLAPGCKGHSQTIVDWEIAALWHNLKAQEDWQDKIREAFEHRLWTSDRESVLYVGNMHRHPQSFLVLGVFWPPRTPIQPNLL